MSARVLVVDDASIFRRIISDALIGIPGVEVIGTAVNGRVGVTRIAELNPDIVTLDIEMPEMNGIEVLDAIRKQGSHSAVIVLSSLTVRGGEMTLRALEGGAFDFITKPEGGSPSENISSLRESLRPIIQTIGRRREIRSLLGTNGARPAQVPIAVPVATVPDRPRPATGTPIVLIGVSTGGPSALTKVIPAFPEKLGAPILIVQHMPRHFTEALAQRLQSRSSIRVKEAQDGEVARPDCVYIAPGGRQMKVLPGLHGDILIRVSDDPPENACRPSVDYLFRSVAQYFPGRSIAAILTGMGNDGTAGLRLLKQGGSTNIAQDEASCVVFGMPREAILAGVVDEVVPLTKVTETIVRAVSRVRT